MIVFLLFEIENFVFIDPFKAKKLYFDFNLDDMELTAKVVIRNIRLGIFGVTFRNIYFDMFASLNPSTLMDSRFKIRFVVVKLWGMFTIDFMLSIELSGGFGLYFSVYFGDDCHAKGGKKVGVPGYCHPNCKCGNKHLYILPFES